MKLVASVMVRNEWHRYLQQTIGSLSEFCDEIRVLDDSSTDEGPEYMRSVEDCYVLSNPGSVMFTDEGAARNRLLEWTLLAKPTHVLTIDADEIVTNGELLRNAAEEIRRDVLTLCMQEVWKADQQHVHIRCDGGWCPHEIPALWKAPRNPDESWRVQQRKLACGRDPVPVRKLWERGNHQTTHAGILHLGWANQQERQQRHERYAREDGGRFHQSRHLDSILWPDGKVRLDARPWPAWLEPRKQALLERINER